MSTNLLMNSPHLYWPVPDSESSVLPKAGEPGSFWENRGDRFHAGSDIYARPGSAVLSVQTGLVRAVGTFTSPTRLPYWNLTYSVLIENVDGIILHYAELGEAFVVPGQPVAAGQVIGRVGAGLNLARIDAQCPIYLQHLKQNGTATVLHLEAHRQMPQPSPDYLGGNYFCARPPRSLLDPAEYWGEQMSKQPLASCAR